jgi:N-acetylglucosamine kinase-like BadF-type ATPase
MTGGGWVIGVDGGGTGSRAVLLSAGGRVEARVEGGAALVTPGGEAEVLESLERLLHPLLATLAPDRVDVLLAGLAGVGREVNRAAFERLLARRGWAASVHVRTDVDVAFEDAFGQGPGLLVVAGTGSVALARTPKGQILRSGGWGSLVGDEGSGYWLGLEGLRAAFQGGDGRAPATALLPALLEHFGAEDLGALMDRIFAAGKREVASAAPRVVAVAATGDPIAEALLDRAAQHLADHLLPLLRGWRDEAESPRASAPVPVAVVGSLLTSGGALHARLSPRVSALGGELLKTPVDPARGAAVWAHRLQGERAEPK